MSSLTFSNYLLSHDVVYIEPTTSCQTSDYNLKFYTRDPKGMRRDVLTSTTIRLGLVLLCAAVTTASTTTLATITTASTDTTTCFCYYSK